MKLKVFAFFVSLVSLVFFYKGAVSPALEIMSRSLENVKVSYNYNDISFSEDDFDSSAGTKVMSITVLSLPEDGKLKLNGTEVGVGEVISANSLSGLSYSFGKTEKVSFRYGYMSSGMACEAEYVISSMDKINFAPSFCDNEKNLISVASGCAYYGIFSASDPENDEISYKIEVYPENGVLTLLSSEKGEYRYRPSSGFTGEDSFEVRAFDEFSNGSEVRKIKVNVINCEGTDYADMKGNKAYSSALLLTGSGEMSGYTIGQVGYFSPDKKVTREEFLTIAMNCAGIVPDNSEKVTAFADENKIDENLSGYIGTAFEKGFLSDYVSGAVNYLRPDENISGKEAKSIALKIFGVLPAEEELLDDNEDVGRDICSRFLCACKDLYRD